MEIDGSYVSNVRHLGKEKPQINS